MDVCLIMFKGDSTKREFPVTKNRVVIGRVNSCDLRIPLSSVSRKHCELKVVRGAVKVNDLGSSNGTYVNGTRIRREESLHPGDRIQVGPVVFTLVVDGVPSVQTPSESLMHAQVEAERKSGDAFTQFKLTQTFDDAKTTPPTPAEGQVEHSPLDDLVEGAGEELLHLSDAQDDESEGSAPIILPDDEDEDDIQTFESPPEDSPQKVPAKPESAGSSVLEEFDSMLEGIDDKVEAEHNTIEQLRDDDLVEDKPAVDDHGHDDEVIGEIDKNSEDDEKIMVLTDDVVDDDDDDEDEDLPVLGDEDDPVAALQAMAAADDSASGSESDIDLSWLDEDEAK